MIDYAWNSKLLLDAEFKWRPRELSYRLKSDLFRGICYLNSSCIRKGVILMFLSSSRDRFTLLAQLSHSPVTDVSVGFHVGAHPDGFQRGVSIQISINLGKTFLLISFACLRNIAVAWILARVFAYLPSFFSQIVDFIYWTGFDFYFDLSWMTWH